MRRDLMEYALLSEYEMLIKRAEETEGELRRLGPDIEEDRSRILNRTFRETIAQTYLIEKVLRRAYGRKESRQIVSDIKWKARK